MSVFDDFKMIENSPSAILKIVDDIRTFLKANETLITDVKLIESKYVQRRNEVEALQIEVDKFSKEIEAYRQERTKIVSDAEAALKKQSDSYSKMFATEQERIDRENKALDKRTSEYTEKSMKLKAELNNLSADKEKYLEDKKKFNEDLKALDELSKETKDAITALAVQRQKLEGELKNYQQIFSEFEKERRDVDSAIAGLVQGQKKLAEGERLLNSERLNFAQKVKEHLKNVDELSINVSEFNKAKVGQDEREKALRKTASDQKDKEKNLNDFKQILDFKDAELKQALTDARRKGVLVG